MSEAKSTRPTWRRYLLVAGMVGVGAVLSWRIEFSRLGMPGYIAFHRSPWSAEIYPPTLIADPVNLAGSMYTAITLGALAGWAAACWGGEVASRGSA